jgi:hypothetical protein
VKACDLLLAWIGRPDSQQMQAEGREVAWVLNPLGA